jgi:protein-S-isoprenylcysteine O-methyltransferase Ste14
MTTPDIGAVQKVRKLALLFAIVVIFALIVVSTPRWPAAIAAVIIWTGRVLILVCVAGRTWCSLYIGGRKTSELVTTGPYSISRNPLYVFSIIGAMGAGAQVGALTIGLLGALVAWVVHFFVVIKEERLLLMAHGDDFRSYTAQVPRFLPRFSIWKDVDVLEVRPRTVVITFLDACFFLTAIPLAGGADYLRHEGVISSALALF